MNQLFDMTNLTNVKPIRDIVYDNLRTAILEGKIKPGERIVEKEYAEMMKISRTPIREALRKLEIEGLVHYIPRKGVVVTEFNKKEIKEIYDIREALECLAIKYTIENITDDELNKIRKIQKDFESFRAEEDFESIFNCIKDFNEMTIYSCKMPRLINMISTLQKHIALLRDINMKNNLSRIDSAFNEHNEILAAIEEKNIEKAEEAVRKHIQSSRKAMFDKLR